ncbi:prorelaxin H1 [Danio aesculapii]|uniref:prorelaxin H1 n=1 Tax=Danio aesculapii TaxID=1142201 RepID=UPI0024BFD4CE|nr:prorelaxin H1 [Danio aesculapii]
MFRVCPALLLVCVCVSGLCVCVSADLPRDFGVKLCGREFIRAVIFTCGGSRWRRADTPSGEVWLDPQQDPLDGAGSPDVSPPDAASPGSHRWSLSSVLQLLAGARVRAPQVGLRAWLQTLSSSPDPAWPRPDRRKRNFSVGLAGMCCNQGCTKNDIGRLC